MSWFERRRNRRAIPILRRLFQSTKRSKRQDEFVIITPRLIEDPAEISGLVAEVSGPGSAPGPILIEMGEKGEKKKD